MKFTIYDYDGDNSNDKICISVPGIPAETIQKGKDFKFTTEVVQNGDDFTWSQIYPGHTMTNKFTVGKESDLETMSGKKFKVSRDWDWY